MGKTTLLYNKTFNVELYNNVIAAIELVILIVWRLKEDMWEVKKIWGHQLISVYKAQFFIQSL